MKYRNTLSEHNLIRLGRYIKDARLENNMSLRELAVLTNVNYRTIYKIERAEINTINPNNLVRISSVLKLDLQKMLTFAGYFELVFRLKYEDK